MGLRTKKRVRIVDTNSDKYIVYQGSLLILVHEYDAIIVVS